VSCVLCGKSARSTVVRAPDFEYGTVDDVEIVRCAGCGHHYVDPVPAPDDVPRLYPPTYYTINPESPLFLRSMVYRVKIRRDVERLARLVGGRVRSIVDLGCGDAVRLAAMAERLGGAPEAIGVDLQFSPAVQAFAAERGLRLLTLNLESDLAALRDGGHDLVLMSQLLEHLRDPPATLARLATKLAPGGRIVIETPNLGGLDYTLFRRRYWGGYHLPRHFHLFDARSLRAAVERAGLRVVRAGFLPSPGFWIISLRNALRLSSARRSRSPWEILNFSNLPVIACFTAIDTLRVALGLPTSNQYVVAERPA
jgi:SAM-dependent methyltransferase